MGIGLPTNAGSPTNEPGFAEQQVNAFTHTALGRCGLLVLQITRIALVIVVEHAIHNTPPLYLTPPRAPCWVLSVDMAVSK